MAEQKNDLFQDDETTITSDPLADLPKGEEKKDEQKQNIQIEVVDDLPDEDRRVLEARQRKQGKDSEHDVELPPLPDSKDDLEKEIAAYGKRSQKRIRQLYERFHDERRTAEEAQRAREEAVRFAENVWKEKQKLEGTLKEGEKYLLEQVKKKAELALEAAKKQYKEAFESGDPDKIAAATEAMSTAVAEKREADAFKSRETLQPEKKTVQGGEQSQQSQAPQQRQAAPDPKAVRWAENNKWFGADEEMTAFAYGLHQRLVMREGVDPRSDDYYARIDKEVRKRFPEKFEATHESRTETRSAPRTVVGAVTRTASSKKVTLTSTQAALAKRLGVPLEVYAQEVLKESGNA